MRADSLDSSGLSSERSDSDQGAVCVLGGAMLGRGAGGGVSVNGRAPGRLSP